MLSVENLTFGYTASRPVLEGVSFEAAKGHCTAILGNNGAGKSTLVQCLCKILTPKSGRVLLDGQDLLACSPRQIARQVAYVAQYGEAARFTVFDTVLLGRKPFIRFSPTVEDYRVVEEILERMELTDLSMAYLDELSGGQRQKVLLARALAQKPQVLLLDEPTSSLDLKNQHGMLALVSRLAREAGLTVLLVIHDLNLALRYCDRFVLMEHHGVRAQGGAEIMTGELLSQVYGMPVTVEQSHGFPVVVPLSPVRSLAS